MKPLKTFIIYSREDEQFKKQFLKHLQPLEGMLDIWNSANLMPGEGWDSEIKMNLTQSDLVIILVSVNSLNSDFIKTSEFTTALELFKQKQVRLVPVIVSNCVWKSHPIFRGLYSFPINLKPVDEWTETDEAWTDIVLRLAEMVVAIWKKAVEEKQDDKSNAAHEKTSADHAGSDELPTPPAMPEKQPPKYPSGSVTRKVELVINALSHSMTQSHNYAVVLQEKGTTWRLPIVIGSFEAQAIAVAMEKMVPNRPLTHDLMKTLIETLDATVKEVIINNILDGIFYTRLILTRNNKDYEVDCRTSDGIALAVRFEVPIYTYSFIMEAASIFADEE